MRIIYGHALISRLYQDIVGWRPRYEVAEVQVKNDQMKASHGHMLKP